MSQQLTGRSKSFIGNGKSKKIRVQNNKSFQQSITNNNNNNNNNSKLSSNNKIKSSDPVDIPQRSSRDDDHRYRMPAVDEDTDDDTMAPDEEPPPVSRKVRFSVPNIHSDMFHGLRGHIDEMSTNTSSPFSSTTPSFPSSPSSRASKLAAPCSQEFLLAMSDVLPPSSSQH